MASIHPTFDIQIGDTVFGQTLINSDRSGMTGKSMTLLDLVKRVVINKNLDKTVTRGKKRVKINTCDVTMSNPLDKDGNGQLDNILRLGRKVQIWLGYGDIPRTRVGVYKLYNPVWKYPRSGVPEVHFKAKAGDVGLQMDFTPHVLHNVTHSEAVVKMVEGQNFKLDIVPTKEKTTLVKHIYETTHDAIGRWAYDCGYDFMIDEKTDPNTLIFRQINERPMTTHTGQEMTVGWGPRTTANLPAAELTIEHKYPDPVPMNGIQMRGPDGKILGPGQKKVFDRGVANAGEKEAASTTQRPGTATSGGLSGKSLAGAAAQKLTKSIDLLYDPGIPYFELGRVVTLVGRGDNSRRYRIVDITHELTLTGYTTRVKAVIGGSPAPSLTAQPDRHKVLGPGQKKVFNRDVESGKARPQ